jgi:DNA-binding MarR family transcriptional regulator
MRQAGVAGPVVIADAAGTGTTGAEGADDGGLDALAEELACVLSRMHTFLRRAILPKDMGISQALALAALRDLGPQRVTDLAEHGGVRQPTCSALVNSMEAEGWVSRQVDGTDRRAVIVELTAKGREVLRSMIEARSRLLGVYLSQLSVADRAALLAAMPSLGKLIELGAESGLV